MNFLTKIFKKEKKMTCETKKVLTSAEVCGETGQTRKVCCKKVRERAYYLWEAAGRPTTDGKSFWFDAENQLLEEAQAV